MSRPGETDKIAAIAGGASRRWRDRLAQPCTRATLRAVGLALIVVVALARAAQTWAVFAATADEPQHIAAGVEWLARTDRPQHEPTRIMNPPVARIAVGVGPYVAGLRSPPALKDLLYAGPGYQRNLALARAGVLPFLALLIVLTWVFTRRAYGEAAAWIATLVVASVPAIIGHGGLATTDVPFAACFLLALLTLLRWVEAPSHGRAIAAGLALGLAAATKLSSVALPLIAVLAVVARRLLGARPGTARRIAVHAPIIAGAALLVVWGAYRFAIDQPAALWQSAWLDDSINACFPSDRGRRAAYWLAAHQLPAPALFLGALGLCAQEAPGRTVSFLLGQLSDDGFPAFFPVALAVKLPLPMSVLAIVGFIAVMRQSDTPDTRMRALAPIMAALATVAVLIPSRTNIGVRHVLHVVPLIAALAGAGVVALWRSPWQRRSARSAAGALVAWALATPFAATPDYFAWFNALAGRHPERVLVDSDLDWGQDLLRLERALAERRVDSVSVAYFGVSDLCRHRLPPLRWLRPHERARGWIAVSEMFVSGAIGTYYRDGNPCDDSQRVLSFTPDPTQYAWLRAYQPVARVGTSILLYDLP